MDLIKVACGMLVIALFTGLVTSGGEKDKISALSLEPQNQKINSDAGGVSGKILEKENESEVAASSIHVPDPLILEKGESKMAVERKNIEKKVQSTARLVEAQGEEIFPKFREKGSAWYQDDFCIFVWTIEGTQIVCPGDRSGEGRDMRGLVDADGKPIGELFIKTALSEKGEGWVEYKWQEDWQKSGNFETLQKCTFVKRASSGRQLYIIGADFNVEKYITCKNLESCEYTDRPGDIRVAELLNPENPKEKIELNYSILHSIVEPGESTAPHVMKNPEVHYILEGKGLLYIDGVPVYISKDQVIYIPAGSIQTTYNTGNTVLKFLIIDQPAWSGKNLKTLETL